MVCLQNDWSVVVNCRKQRLLLVFGVKQSVSLVEFKSVCGNLSQPESVC